MHGQGDGLAPADRALLSRLQRQALQYFVDNQAANGLVLDRQSNHGPRRDDGICSTAATGMGMIALALASAPEFQLLSSAGAAGRVKVAARGVLDNLPHEQGMVPHFIDPRTGAIYGNDYLSTVETSWLLAGILWAADFLKDPELDDLALRLYRRVDWLSWSVLEGPGRLLR